MYTSLNLHLLITLASFIFKYVDGWSPASLTFYGNAAYNNDKDSIHSGTCSCIKARAYNICYNNWCFESISDPRMITAINTHGSQNTVNCGKCVEIKCDVGRYRGTPSSEFGASNVCYNMTKSIIVQITDSCPEIHRNPNNRKYCNASFVHFDLSFWAFAYVANHKYGVVDAKYRYVKCPTNVKKTFGVVNNSCCTQGRQCISG